MSMGQRPCAQLTGTGFIHLFCSNFPWLFQFVFNTIHKIWTTGIMHLYSTIIYLIFLSKFMYMHPFHKKIQVRTICVWCFNIIKINSFVKKKNTKKFVISIIFHDFSRISGPVWTLQEVNASHHNSHTTHHAEAAYPISNIYRTISVRWVKTDT